MRAQMVTSTSVITASGIRTRTARGTPWKRAISAPSGSKRQRETLVPGIRRYRRTGAPTEGRIVVRALSRDRDRRGGADEEDEGLGRPDETQGLWPASAKPAR